MALSMSSLSATPSQYRATASFRAGISMRFTIKPGESFLTRTVSFSILWATSWIVCMVSSDVFAPLIISISFMSCGGLKKCIPATFSGRFVAEASSVILTDDVFEAIMACAGAYVSTSLNVAFFSSGFSGTASMTRSALCTASLRSRVG